MKIRIIIITSLLALIACNQTKQAGFQPVRFPFVQVPAMITDQREATAYISSHYWDEFTDTSAILPSYKVRDESVADSVVYKEEVVNGVRRQDVEQAFADYLAVLGRMPVDKAAETMASLFDKCALMEAADSSSSVFETLTFLVSYYLYDPNSPYRNEDVYYPFVRKMAAYEGFDAFQTQSL